MRLTDFHVHVSLFSDAEAVLKTASLHGIRLIGMSCDAADARRNLELSSRFHYPVMLGIHPWYQTSPDFPLSDFEELYNTGSFCGFGECGMDGVRGLPLPDQEKLLRAELDFACGHNLCVNLHVRKCHNELMKVLRDYKGRLLGAVHNFTFSKEVAKSYLDLGLSLSCGHHLVYMNERLVGAVKYAGINHVVLETDLGGDHPYDPELLKREYECLGRILGLDFEKTAECVETNCRQILGF